MNGKTDMVIPLAETSTPPPAVVAVAKALSAELAAEQPANEPANEPATGAAPLAMLEGTFAIYQDGHGGFVLVTDTVQHGTDRRHIPAAMVKLATGGGMISRRLAGMFGGG